MCSNMYIVIYMFCGSCFFLSNMFLGNLDALSLYTVYQPVTTLFLCKDSRRGPVHFLIKRGYSTGIARSHPE